MSTIKVNNIENRTGSSITIGGSSTTSLNLASTITGGTLTNTPAFYAKNGANQTITSGSNTKVLFATEDFDTDNCYTSSTFTPTTAGKYFIHTQINFDINATTNSIEVRVHKNGTMVVKSRKTHYYGNSQQTYIISTIQEANGTSDYFEIYTSQNSGSDRTLVGDAAQTYFTAYRLIGA